MTRELKGWHVAAIFCVGFGIIIAVNLTLAFNAVATFPGLVVKNSYIASQKFEAQRDAQDALGWQTSVTYTDGTLVLDLTGANARPAEVSELEVVVGRTTHVAADATPELRFDGAVWRAPMTLDPGHWLIRLNAVAPDGTTFERSIPLFVGG